MKHARKAAGEPASIARSLRLFGLIALCGVLAACSSRSAGIYETAQTAFESAREPDPGKLNPAIRYLRVVNNGSTALLALGYIDADALGPVEVWYSGAGEVLRLQNGHVIGMTGTAEEWRQVRLSGMAAWPAGSASTAFTRIRDTMPGYRFNVTDQMTMRQTQPPSKSNLLTLKPDDLRWYEAVDREGRLPPTRIALAPGTADNAGATAGGAFTTPVYGEQCLSPSLCISWQQWPPAAAR